MKDSKKTYPRREFLRGATVGALGAVAVGCTIGAVQEPPAVIVPTEESTTEAAPTSVQQVAPPAAAKAAPPVQQAVEPRIDRVLRNGVLRVGVDLTFPPLQFRDPATDEPQGYMPEIDEMMARDLGVDLEYVEMPFGGLIAGLQADRFDWIGIAFTSTPRRAQEVLFIDEPAFVEESFLLLRKGFEIESLDDLNDAAVTISNQVGSAQDASARLMFPEATFKPLEFPEYILEVAAERSDAALTAIWSAATYLNENPGTVDIWEGGALFADVNTFYVPLGDYKTKEWMGTWFRYYSAHRWFENRFNYWVNTMPGYAELKEAFGRQ